MDLMERQKFIDLFLSGRGQAKPTFAFTLFTMCEKTLRETFVVESQGVCQGGVEKADVMAAVEAGKLRGDCPENNVNMAPLYEALEDFAPFAQDVQREEARLGNALKAGLTDGNITFLGRGRPSAPALR